MCGRFSLAEDIHRLQMQFQFEYEGEYFPRYNIAPSQNILTVIQGNEGRIGKQLRWGLIPFWAKDEKIGYKLINARAETLDEKASFKHPLKKRRCLILADGFYEWKKDVKTKQPYRFVLKNREPFAFAGLWDRWEKGNEVIYSCTIITTRPNELAEKVHDRMPVILTRENQNAWLDRTIEDTEYLKSLLVPYDAEEMEAYEVSTLINSPKNETKEVIAPVK